MRRFLDVADPRVVPEWHGFVSDVFVEEHVSYELDDQCGVHYKVDAEFVLSKQSAIAALEHPSLINARTAFEDAHRHFDGTPQDTKAAVRSMFEAVELIAKLICPESKNLNKWLAENTLAERCTEALSGGATERATWSLVLPGLGDWVEGLHNYRHGQPDAAPPSAQLCIHALSVGAAYLRTLAQAFARSCGT